MVKFPKNWSQLSAYLDRKNRSGSKRTLQKLFQKQVACQIQTRPYSNARRLPVKQPRVRTIKKERSVQAALAALFLPLFSETKKNRCTGVVILPLRFSATHTLARGLRYTKNSNRCSVCFRGAAQPPHRCVHSADSSW